MANLESILRSIDITLLTEVCIAKPMTFPVAMCGCEIWTIRRLNDKELMLSVVLEKIHETPLDCKEIKLVHPKGNQS